ncbi:MAG: hypothetical protein Q4D98_03470 [Planctomycetia bacterium]|nr:hypothetical protein [Planctomycetia bacterium]
MNAIIKNIILANIRSMITEQLTPANVKKVFACTLEQFRAWAKNTDTKLDDWVIDTMEPYALSDQAAESFVAGIKALMSSSGVLFNAPPKASRPGDTLMLELTPCFAAWKVLEEADE